MLYSGEILNISYTVDTFKTCVVVFGFSRNISGLHRTLSVGSGGKIFIYFIVRLVDVVDHVIV